MLVSSNLTWYWACDIFSCYLSFIYMACTAYKEIIKIIFLPTEPGFYKDGEYGIRLETQTCVVDTGVSLLTFMTGS